MRWLLALLLVVGVACEANDPSPEDPTPRAGGADSVPSEDPPNSADGDDGTWGLTSGHNADGEIPLVEGFPITLLIDGHQISGTSSCNYYGANATIDGSSFDIDEDSFSGTLIGCSGDVATAEERYLSAIREVDSISRADDELTLTGPNTALVYEYLPPPPTASLIDTTWHLESLVHGRGPGGFVNNASPAELILHGNGKLGGSTGCRELSGEWIEGGHTIEFTRFGAQGHCPPELRDQDDHIVGVLGDGFTAKVEGNELTIYAARGTEGLIYRSN